MTAQDDAFASLRSSGLLDVLAWAAPTAFAATDQVYDEDAGHDQAVMGILNHKHLCDLLDRATSNGRYTLAEDVAGVGRDVLERGVHPDALRAMPAVPAGTVGRLNYRQSPGWAIGGVRILLQSFVYGHVDEINWAQRSDAKRLVAAQSFLAQATLFDDREEEFGVELVAGIPDDEFPGITLIVAHAFNSVTKQFQVYVGQSKNPEFPKDSCWHWRELVLSGGTPPSGVSANVPPMRPGGGVTTDVEDVPVRMRRRGAGDSTGVANGH